MLVADHLIKQQMHTPDRIAFSENGRDTTYRSFFVNAGRISHVLLHHGVRPGDRVCLLLSRGIDAAQGIYGILFAGACYVPLDPQNPASRLAYIMGDVRPRCIIGIGACPEWCDASVEWIDLNNPQLFGDEQHGDIDGVYRSSPEDLAAILYTSGSTGNPKGVSISCRAIDAFVFWSATTFGIGKEDRIASLAPFHFDLSLFDLFTGVYCGARTCFVPQSLTLSPKKLVAWFDEVAITSWYTVPSILGFLALRGGLAPGQLPAMKRILFAGEVFPLPGLIRLAQALPHVALYNLFGPTETNVCTFWPVQRSRLETLESVPIGGSACEAELMISDSGELLVNGPCLMSGYWQEGHVQALDHPWYHTGDRVSRNDHDELLYHGRMDRMIKSSGYRIEPAEIEAVINRFEAVRGSVLVGESDPICGQRLVAVVAGKSVDLEALRAYLKQNLVAYMQPYRFVQLQAIPLLTNGKVDYRAVAGMI
ncbi:MAG: phenylalanine racemase [Zetaproteobacteria bacterium CG12_big_fil_rev_8_21_14_0_65_55_1124]|nr:MAG: hypothetical protein AUJ58_04025 [Zetaproteobacteria bacterium CG1_02_55_237]PIS20366.1 MAG: phenylalanine racemase [Zetaproteobacteria bacterium CG08_land_8_20_14_0_20_55_17]PIW42409.1 MAG: phenylalanine racemase [Zetaproteobacteria bacterium CG12_big_fil_rev_8_21_14_0_65_55_1124]PIY52368.1 MAG: phenylalanine racemase [Zetaproteobacteria bacterium CG_4_10_14_0_8_um_filter_55_43]PIZ37147.1 MAG: phenylalanine racemase [Zetaproteobacteria bacterium CG_4_10_14_0_2_um_filter_55_20]PJB81765